ncbi:MAG: CDGSH iron-sulfur domain-containing protein [Elusimicrobia bacterium]|nr:CDGSH iron-sulfur domain-containing protein [Elusimicrobiota bacterium]MDE2425892.1 CDGSH iron-sulfur domain-containing protein [Elusimicrobiota bacterium]
MSTKRDAPWVVEEQPGKKAWCSCGESLKQPYCDGSHARLNTGKRPVICEIDQPKKVAWCGCKRTKTPPFCDGSHKTPATQG